METQYDFVRRGHYLAALALVEQEYADAEDDAEERFRIGQDLATLFSFCGDHAAAKRAFPTHPNPEAPLPVGGTPEDALARILKETQDRQVVILNEAHHLAHHRALGMSLLSELRAQGFTHFAAEVFSKPEVLAASTQLGGVTRQTGYYTHEPTFAAYVREALRLGFQLVAYESEIPAPLSATDEELNNHRDLQEANNLYERIFKDQPDARVLIYVGYDHLVKTPIHIEITQPEPLSMTIYRMAMRLIEQTGIDPLTIDQTQGEGRLPEIQQPTILRMPDGSSGASGDLRTADLYVFHPVTQYQQGRPDWLLRLPHRRAVSIPTSLIPASGRVLIQAFRESEPQDAIAWDRVLLTTRDCIPVLVLPPGNYRVEQQTEADLQTEFTTLSVI